ncbi:carboxypeptidase-like regulatory domain-containing protein [Fuerstiella marisgermanici]|uniref:Carboxypeptidase regulatory-like domain-containing protein n=1 Tax=Fuerstiella marisgermanici TaxID=1891926 RepID=A0A1P8WGA2_9PLAN|nr:carboxypeptidase-like regulatory domain-containing protein [Fuerstiella marisgermanici]APZ93072.1 hypothetical protein Fuma_02688 [Fuerstiella marisgermanici]
MSIIRYMALAGTLSIFVGCGDSGPEIATVTGTITMDDAPLPNASIIFQPERGRPAGARSDENGEYELNFSGGRMGAQPGTYIVAIRTAREGSIEDDGSRSPGKPETVPAQYNVSSELRYTVEADKANVADFNLTSDGELPEEKAADDN